MLVVVVEIAPTVATTACKTRIGASYQNLRTAGNSMISISITRLMTSASILQMMSLIANLKRR